MSLYTVQIRKDGRLVLDGSVDCRAWAEEADEEHQADDGGELLYSTEAEENADFEGDLQAVLRNWNFVMQGGADRASNEKRIAPDG